jgi:hypothetical protein
MSFARTTLGGEQLSMTIASTRAFDEYRKFQTPFHSSKQRGNRRSSRVASVVDPRSGLMGVE